LDRVGSLILGKPHGQAAVITRALTSSPNQEHRSTQFRMAPSPESFLIDPVHSAATLYVSRLLTVHISTTPTCRLLPRAPALGLPSLLVKSLDITGAPEVVQLHIYISSITPVVVQRSIHTRSSKPSTDARARLHQRQFPQRRFRPRLPPPNSCLAA
jgi:hypothetical protein